MKEITRDGNKNEKQEIIKNQNAMQKKNYQITKNEKMRSQLSQQ